MRETCSHLDLVHKVSPSSTGCEECLAMGSKWVHLRICLVCGHVGCCDASPNRHARLHAENARHPLIQSFEPGERWIYCFEDDMLMESNGFPAWR